MFSVLMVNEYMIVIGCRLMIWLKLINNIIHRIKNRDNFKARKKYPPGGVGRLRKIASSR